MHKLLDTIIRISSSLPPAEKKIAHAILENPEAIESRTLSQISFESGTSEASIVRFCKRLGFSGYTELKNTLTAERQATPLSSNSIYGYDDMTTVLSKLYQSNLEVLGETLAILRNDYEVVLNKLIQARSIHFFAVGDANMVAKLFEIKFKRLGVFCSAEEDVMLQMLTASNLTKDDVAIAISYEGRSRNVVETMQIAKKRGATTISITNKPKSPLLQYTDITLMIAAHDMTIGRDKVTRRISDQFILEGLYMGYRARLGKKCDDKIRVSQEAIDYNKIK